MSDTDLCPSCGGDCGMSDCPECGGCENAGTQPCPACQPSAAEALRCYICEEGPASECMACDGSGSDEFSADGRCHSCGGIGAYVPEHCCYCGGSPYCACCPACGASCIGDCRCPVTVEHADGTVTVLGPASGEEVPGAR